MALANTVSSFISRDTSMSPIDMSGTATVEST
jgi:hypothetical protein